MKILIEESVLRQALKAFECVLYPQMHTEGATTNAIAKVVGVSRPTISRLLSGATWSKP